MRTGLLLTGSITALIYAYLVRFLAVAFQTVEAGLTRVTPSMDDAARSLGLSPGRTLVRVHMPIMCGSLATAALLVFVDVMKELPATFAMRPFNFDTLAVEAYNLAKDERIAEAAVPSLVMVAIALLPLILLSRQIASSSQRNHGGSQSGILLSSRTSGSEMTTSTLLERRKRQAEPRLADSTFLQTFFLSIYEHFEFHPPPTFPPHQSSDGSCSPLDLLFLTRHRPFAAGDEAKRVVALIDYIGGDYRNAVQGRESRQCRRVRGDERVFGAQLGAVHQLKAAEGDKAGIEKDLNTLTSHIKNKTGDDAVPKLAQQIKDRLIKTYNIVTYPKASAQL